MKNILLATFAILGSTIPAHADGPFGINMGQPLSELDARSDKSVAQLASVPKPHPDFQSYTVFSTKETGVCVLNAISKSYDNDRFGTNVRADFDKFAAALDMKYGPHKLLDHRGPGGIWKDADEWVMSIKQNERLYAATWDKPQNDTNLSYIELRVLAIQSDNTVLKLMYKGQNSERCLSLIEAKKNDSF